jgi:hypothetical protein
MVQWIFFVSCRGRRMGRENKTKPSDELIGVDDQSAFPHEHLIRGNFSRSLALFSITKNSRKVYRLSLRPTKKNTLQPKHRRRKEEKGKTIIWHIITFYYSRFTHRRRKAKTRNGEKCNCTSVCACGNHLRCPEDVSGWGKSKNH